MNDAVSTFGVDPRRSGGDPGASLAFAAVSLATRGFDGRSAAMERWMRCRAATQPCPTCGLTRSVLATLRGEWERARQWHPAGPRVVGWMLVQGALRLAMMRVTRLRLHVVDVVQLVTTGIWVTRIGWISPA